MWLHGSTHTGKSTFADIMTRLYGDYHRPMSSKILQASKKGSNENSEKNFFLDCARGAKLISVAEWKPGAELDSDYYCSITGSDKITARGLYQNYKDWYPTWGGFIFHTNSLPKNGFTPPVAEEEQPL